MISNSHKIDFFNKPRSFYKEILKETDHGAYRRL